MKKLSSVLSIHNRLLCESQKIDSESEFKEYAKKVLKSAHGEKYDEAVATKLIDDLIKKYDEDYEKMIGIIQSSLNESLELFENQIIENLIESIVKTPFTFNFNKSKQIVEIGLGDKLNKKLVESIVSLNKFFGADSKIINKLNESYGDYNETFNSITTPEKLISTQKNFISTLKYVSNLTKKLNENAELLKTSEILTSAYDHNLSALNAQRENDLRVFNNWLSNKIGSYQLAPHIVKNNPNIDSIDYIAYLFIGYFNRFLKINYEMLMYRGSGENLTICDELFVNMSNALGVTGNDPFNNAQFSINFNKLYEAYIILTSGYLIELSPSIKSSIKTYLIKFKPLLDSLRFKAELESGKTGGK